MPSGISRARCKSLAVGSAVSRPLAEVRRGHHPADLLLKEVFPLVVHLAHHMRGENAIDAADDLIGRMSDRLRAVGLMARPKVVRDDR